MNDRRNGPRPPGGARGRRLSRRVLGYLWDSLLYAGYTAVPYAFHEYPPPVSRAGARPGGGSADPGHQRG